MPWEAQINGYFIGGALFLLLLVFFIKTIAGIVKGSCVLDLWDISDPRGLLMKRLGLILLIIAYIVIIQWTGYALATFLFLLAAMLLLGVRSPVALLVVSAVFTFAGYLFFIVLIDTNLPQGPLEHIFAGFF